MKWPVRWWQRRSRGARYGLALAAAIFGSVAVALLTSPWWLTPVLLRERPLLEKAATKMVGAPVRVAGLAAVIGWRPGFTATGVVIGGGPKPAVVIKAVRVQLSWVALLGGHLRPAFVGVDGAELDLRKTPTGFQVIGLPHHGARAFPRWESFLRSSRKLAITDGRVGLVLSPHRALSFQHLNASWSNGILGRDRKSVV